MLVTLLFIVVGGLAGFAFHRLVGCRSGACAIWANPYLATVYGAAIGFLFGGTR